MRSLFAVLVAALFSVPVFAEPAKEADRRYPKILKPGEHGVGRLAPDIAFTDVNGKTGKVSDFKDKKAVVIAVTSTSCPKSLKFAPTLARHEKAYREKGVAFIFVNAVATDEPADIEKAIAEHGFTGPYIHDKDGAFSKAIGALTTTDTIVLDPARTIVYHGAVDDQYGSGYTLDEPRHRYLIPALDALLAGKSIAIPATEAAGCDLDLEPAKSTSALTYHNQVERLVQAHCIECHRKGGVAPFSLETYKDVVAHAGQIKKEVDRGTMPPWFAAAPAKGPTPWLNDRTLTATEKGDMLAWLKGDKAEGNVAEAPRPRTFDEGWQIGKPDAIIRPTKPVKVKAEGTMPYQNVMAESNFDEDKWIQALEVRPSAKQVVHHVLVFVLPPEKKGERPNLLDGIARNEGQGYYAIYVPGNSTLVYGEGFGKRFPKGSKVRFQIHYTPNGTATEDTTELGLIFAKEKPKYEVRVAGIVNTWFQIPPGADNHAASSLLPVPFDAKIIALLPHMHLRGKAFRFEAKAPGGKNETLLDVPHYDFNWQLRYEFAEPRPVPKGSMLFATGWFDNSDKNPANPDATKTVKWGPQTFDEMMLGYVEYYIP
ncbi:MAG TPA: redoxin family protein [Gemmataceae bacterium]|jgi:peroxiredoxin/mono/diheme cytochrome c family protein|nr:redoxin family protein [Gemmataceae bacterium]